MAKKTWIVTTSGDRPLEDVAKELKKHGFEVGDVLDAVGCITGEADDEGAEKARNVRGVTDVSSTVPADVGPPDSPETW